MTGAVLGCLGAGPALASEPTVKREDTRLLSKLTGPGPLNFTDARWNILGADLGHMFEFKGRIYMVFGDNFGYRPTEKDVNDFLREYPGNPDLELQRYGNFRSSAMAHFDGALPEVGPIFDGMITEPGDPLRAKELLSSAKQRCDPEDPGFCEATVIPTNGFAVGDRMFLHYMSVKSFGIPDDPHVWPLNHSGIAYSDDGGQNWTKEPLARWAGDSKFGQVAATQVGPHVFLFGIPGGRYDDARLARVDRDAVLRNKRYRYWDGRGWSAKESAAVPVAGGPVGELSVQWNSYFGKWLMTYLRSDLVNVGRGQIVLRTADCLTGPWSDAQVVTTSDDYPSLYAPFIPPRWNDGPNLYFSMSIFTGYQVYWMRTPLTGDPRPGREPCVSP